MTVFVQRRNSTSICHIWKNENIQMKLMLLSGFWNSKIVSPQGAMTIKSKFKWKRWKNYFVVIQWILHSTVIHRKNKLYIKSMSRDSLVFLFIFFIKLPDEEMFLSSWMYTNHEIDTECDRIKALQLLPQTNQA